MSSSASLYGALSPPYRPKIRLGKQMSSPSSNSTDHRPSPPPSLSRTLSHNESISPAYHLLDNNNERRLIIRCGITITNYHISKLFDLVPNMEECSSLSLNTFKERRKFELKVCVECLI